MKFPRLLFLLVSLFFSLSLSAQKKGDVNGDQTVDISDVVAVINTMAGDNTYKSTSDVNNDGDTDISDVVAIINIIANGNGGSVGENDPAVEAGMCPDNNHPHVIDLGHAGKWACCNVGASAPWEYGGYYAWGETEEKDYYDWSTYIHYDGSPNTSHNIGSDISGTDYDVAYVKWGGKWRMPSLEQLRLLINSCTSKLTTFNGIPGWKYTGSNGNSIFLPAAGGRWRDNTDIVGNDGFYWSSTQFPDYSDGAYDLYFYGNYSGWSDSHRSLGFSVRPVTE